MPNITIVKENGLIKVNFGDYYKGSPVPAKAIAHLNYQDASFPYGDLRRVAKNEAHVMVRLANGIQEEWYLSHEENLLTKVLEVDSITIGGITTEPTSLVELRTLLEALMVA